MLLPLPLLPQTRNIHFCSVGLLETARVWQQGIELQDNVSVSNCFPTSWEEHKSCVGNMARGGGRAGREWQKMGKDGLYGVIEPGWAHQHSICSFGNVPYAMEHMESCSTKPGCQSAAHQYSQAEVVQPVDCKCVLICYLNAHRDFSWHPYAGVRSIEDYCYLCVGVVWFFSWGFM